MNVFEFTNEIGATMADYKICRRFGGQTIYIPKVPPDAKERIRREFNGGNHYLLADKYGVTLSYVREAIRNKS